MGSLGRLVGVVTVVLICACSGPDAKKMKFYAKGKKLYEQGNLVKARLSLKNAVQIDPRFSDAYHLLGMVELKQGNLGTAYAAFSKAVESNPRHLDAQVQLGALLLIAGSLDKAGEKAQLVLKEQPQHEEGLLLQGALLIAGKEPLRAAGVMTEMVKRGVRRCDVYLMLAAAQRALSKEAEGEATLLRGISRNPTSVTLHRALADLYADQGRIDAAAERIRTMMALEPKNHRYGIALANLLLRGGRTGESLEVVRRVLAQGSAEPCYLDVARFFQDHGRSAEAEGALAKGIAANPRSFRLRLALADLYRRTGRADQGVAVLKQCLALEKDPGKPQVIETKNALGRVQLARGEHLDAERWVDEVLKESPHNLEAKLIKARLYLSRGDGARAVTTLRTMVGDKPEDTAAYLLLADAYLVREDAALALQTLQQAQKLDPSSPQVALAMARYYVRQKDFPEAEAQLRQALVKRPQDPELRLELGEVFFAARNFRQAEACYLPLKRVPAAATAARVKLSELYEATGRAEQARAELLQGMAEMPHSPEFFNRLLKLYLKERNFAAATSLCRERIAASPGDGAGYLLLASVQDQVGDQRGAEQSLQQAQRHPASWERASLALAQLYKKQGKLQKSRALYQALLAQKPDSLPAANDYACLLADYGDGKEDLKEALKLAEQVCARRPGDPLLMDTLGWVHYRRGDLNKALPLLEKAAARLPSPVVRYHLGMTLYRCGKQARAREQLRGVVSSPVEFLGLDEAREIFKKL